MGSIGITTSSVEYDNAFKYWLDRNYGDTYLAMKDYVSDNYIPSELEFGNKIYEVIDDAGMNIKVVKEANPNTDSEAEVTVEVYVQEKGTNKKPKWWTIKERHNHRKAKIFNIPIYK